MAHTEPGTLENLVKPQQERTVLSVLSKAGLTLDDVDYLFDEAENGRAGSDLPLLAVMCSHAIRRAKKLGKDVTGYERRIPREALETYWKTRMEKDLKYTLEYFDTKDLQRAYEELTSWSDQFVQAEADGMDVTKIKKSLNEEVSKRVVWAYYEAMKSTDINFVIKLIDIHALADINEGLFKVSSGGQAVHNLKQHLKELKDAPKK